MLGIYECHYIHEFIHLVGLPFRSAIHVYLRAELCTSILYTWAAGISCGPTIKSRDENGFLNKIISKRNLSFPQTLIQHLYDGSKDQSNRITGAW